MTLKTSYIELSELRDSPYSIGEQEAGDAYLTVLIGMTQNLIDRFCGRSFLQVGDAQNYVEKKYDGEGEGALFFKDRLISLSGVKIYYTDTSYNLYSAANFFAKTFMLKWNEFAPTDQNIRLTFQTEIFPKGVNNIGIVGIWGFLDSSHERIAIKYLQGKMIRKIISNDSFSEKMISYSSGDFSGTLNIDSTKGQITGDKEIDLLIQTYRKKVSYAIS